MKKTVILIIATLMSVSLFTASGAETCLADSSAMTDKKPKKGKELKEVIFHVHLHCENCVKKVVENISFEKGVKDLNVSLEDQTVYVKYDGSKTSEATLKAAIEKLGYKVEGAE